MRLHAAKIINANYLYQDDDSHQPSAKRSCGIYFLRLNVMEKGLNLIQRVAICFAAGLIGGLAVVLFSHVLFELGLSAIFGVKVPISLNPPDIYTPLFWAVLWGIPLGVLIKSTWNRLYFFGLL